MAPAGVAVAARSPTMGLVGKTVPMMISSAGVPFGVTWVVGGTLGLADAGRILPSITLM